MRIEIFHVDSFAKTLFTGNPAAVCILPSWISDDYLCKIAAENNLSETAYLVPSGDNYEIRWFTPTTEVDLCGHATLASGYVISRFFNPNVRSIRFSSKSGPLAVRCENDSLVLDFPVQPGRLIENSELVSRALGFAPTESLVSAALS